jgi:pyridoxal phosphate enzyme (YggS family)
VTEPTTHALARRLADVRDRIERAARAADRSPSEVILLGVTKTHPPAVARAAVELGLVDLAENRVQELVAKRPEVPGARWHLIGQLQRNKVRDVVGTHVLVHSVDRRSLVDALSRRAHAAQVVQRLLIQVNVGDDPAKGGCGLTEAADLVAYARSRPNLAVEGLMTIPPLPPPGQDAASAARPHFAALRATRDELRAEMPELAHLSMGMSADLEAAVAEGATMVRIGTALFGPRGAGPWRKDAA